MTRVGSCVREEQWERICMLKGGPGFSLTTFHDVFLITQGPPDCEDGLWDRSSHFQVCFNPCLLPFKHKNQRPRNSTPDPKPPISRDRTSVRVLHISPNDGIPGFERAVALGIWH